MYMQNSVNQGDVMDIINLKLLGVYYSVQRSLRNNIATPMARDVKPIIAFLKDDFELLTKKVIPHINGESNPEKMNQHFGEVFNAIDAGRVKPEQYLGHEFSVDHTIEQMQIHDSFMALYDAFFRQFDNDSADSKESQRLKDSFNQSLLKDIKSLGLQKNEMWMFKEMLTTKEQRSPITLDIEVLRDVVDAMYEVSTTQHGPVVTDRMLSDAVKESSIIVPDFSPDNFL